MTDTDGLFFTINASKIAEAAERVPMKSWWWKSNNYSYEELTRLAESFFNAFLEGGVIQITEPKNARKNPWKPVNKCPMEQDVFYNVLFCNGSIGAAFYKHDDWWISDGMDVIAVGHDITHYAEIASPTKEQKE